MKKTFIYLGVFALTLLIGCSQESADEFIAKQPQSLESDVIEIPSNGILPDSITKSLVKKYPEFYTFDKPNSELWIHESESGTKATNVTYEAVGYDKVIDITTYKLAFAKGYIYDSRVLPGYTTYIAQIKQYLKYVTIPVGTSIVIPPANIMSTMQNMGRHPGGSPETPNNVGYTSRLLSTGSNGDKYELKTEVVVITHNVSGQHVFNPPVYTPGLVKDPSKFIFKYQYTNW